MTDKAKREVVGSLGLTDEETEMLRALSCQWKQTPYEAIRTAIVKEHERCIRKN